MSFKSANELSLYQYNIVGYLAKVHKRDFGSFEIFQFESLKNCKT